MTQQTRLEVSDGDVITGQKGTVKGDEVGIVSYTYDGREYTGAAALLIDDSGSVEMAVDARFTGTPENVYVTDPTTNWTNSDLAGTWDFSSTTHAFNAVVTVVDYTLLSGDSVTIDGTGITNTTVTEGVEWTAATSNTATATSLASALNAVSGVSATSSGAVVTVAGDDATDITTFTTTDGTNLPGAAESIDATATVDGDAMLMERSSALDMSGFEAITGVVYITSFDDARHSLPMEFRLAGSIVGNSVNINEYLNTGDLNAWKQFSIPKSDLGLNGSNIDQIVIETVSTNGQPQNYYLGRFNIEEQGGKLFSYAPQPGQVFEINTVQFTFRGGVTTIEPGVFMGAGQLANGIRVRTEIGGQTSFSGGIRNFYEMVSIGPQEHTRMVGASESIICMISEFPGAFSRLTGDDGDRYSLFISDDLTGLTSFRTLIRGRLLR